MKNKTIIITLISITALFGCKKNPCAGAQTYQKLDSRIPNYFYQVGSYWVYRDSADGITDSQYIYDYRHRVHYRDPADSPSSTPGGLYVSTFYCGPYYLDDIHMGLKTFRNGVPYDTISLHGSGGADAGVDIYQGDSASSTSYGAIAFFLDWSKTGFLNCCDRLISNGASYDTAGSWYVGSRSSVASGPYTFSNIQIWTVQIDDGLFVRFTYPTDLYISEGYGIVKMVTHKPAGDVRWDLINYKIAN
jgi:hypothetical protein